MASRLDQRTRGRSTEFGFVEIKTDMISEETAHSQTSEGIVIRLKAGNTIMIRVSTQSHVIELVLSADSHAVAQNIAMYYSFFGTCRANEINLSKWREDVLQRTNNLPFSKIREL
ncbi:hypothetical protein, partial [Persicobacter diffluens]|uniref:hypothetical protein n=1 Tax=Persicobacter diffluens TaxID=981 RepID=UPI003B97D9A7